ncbi:thiamine pyrophosphokinase [Dactylonectria macrodidyma]|uniref:Thiamine pyrophosphokinase n=1 Tax=Dactylonectria macrodidyma TaxID=307937 RepID=A0A9P9IL49_9HYPO|nr:thiamine pyrophosphokinase [Dactylonectria macrodidyma]
MVPNLAIVTNGDSFPYTIDQKAPDSFTYYHFQVANVSAVIGYVTCTVVDVLRNLPEWLVDDATHAIWLMNGSDIRQRSVLMEQAVFAIQDRGRFDILAQWRNETFPIYGPKKEILFHLERSACPLFGVVTYGVHALAYVPPQSEDDELKVWVSRRAKTKQTYGGMLDSTSAGGMTSGESPLETLVKECEQEASLTSEMVLKHTKASGVVTHFYVHDGRPGGEIKLLQPECQYVYDLPLPPHVCCKKNDDEVDEFLLWNTTEIRQRIASGEFKPNSARVMLNFLIRHGVVSPENEENYLEIVSRLHR